MSGRRAPAPIPARSATAAAAREPTVTDADLVCGFLNPDYFLGGSQRLDIVAARAALETQIAAPMKMTVAQAAAGVRRIVDMRMADEVRVFAARRGVDLTDFMLLPFGGAGAVHAAAVAEELGMRRIIVPLRPGAFSALGLLCTDVLHDYIRSELKPLAQLDRRPRRGRMFREIEAEAAAELKEEGLDPGQASFERELDLRYAGQGYELRVPLAGLWQGALDAAAIAKARERFDEQHTRVHGHAAAEKAVELVSYRVRVRVTCRNMCRARRPRQRPPRRFRQRSKATALSSSPPTVPLRPRSSIATNSPSAPPLRDPPLSSNSMRRQWCRPAGPPRSTAIATWCWSGRHEAERGIKHCVVLAQAGTSTPCPFRCGKAAAYR